MATVGPRVIPWSQSLIDDTLLQVGIDLSGGDYMLSISMNTEDISSMGHYVYDPEWQGECGCGIRYDAKFYQKRERTESECDCPYCDNWECETETHKCYCGATLETPRQIYKANTTRTYVEVGPPVVELDGKRIPDTLADRIFTEYQAAFEAGLAARRV